ncbi:LacI family DNA-binding transcriptional regulator [Gayadomonas joobiniege]|uniref:LacI family DNA-binding transcriptional regulator n=1 Tax=Gayadomonas joobiniege TaxID=1234606 RepID=UPI00037F6A8B|nr:LacI family DNA-binding transcriptional regulator [Gayadomonas joobiniege]
MQSNKPLTLKKVASILNVSTATISNAFNRPDQLSARLRERILSECERLGYHGPNLAARSLRKGESGVIGVLLTDSLAYHFTDAVANQFLQGISEVLEKNNKQLLMLSGCSSGQIATGIEALPDGFIIYGTQDHNPLFERIIRQNKPIVTVDFDSPDYPSVNIDNHAAAFEIANHLLAQSVDTLAILGLRLIHSDRVCRITQDELYDQSESVSRRRLDAYIEAIKNNNLDIDAERIWHIPLNLYEQAKQAAKEALTSLPRVNGIICMSDTIALAVLSVAQELNISVPQDLKVIGFDDIPEAKRATPPLTTVCQGSKLKGQLAAEALLDKHQNTTKLMVPTELVIRKSC